MNYQLIWAIILAMAPVSELRGGMPVAIDYALKNNIPLVPIIALIILANIVVVFFIFYFLDTLHKKLMKIPLYKKGFKIYLARMQKKVDRFEEKYSASGFSALAIFVAIPFPTTGAWTGTFIAWILGLNRRKSIIAISIGVLIAGIIMALASLGILNLFY